MTTALPCVLIVDDDEDITCLLAAYLERYQMRAVVASDGVQMWQQLQRHPVDLVVLDVMLPGTDGLTLARQIRQKSAIAVIMLTARGHMVDRVMGLEMGADDYVTKPFEPRELVARIHTVLRRAAGGGADWVSAGVGGALHFDGWVLHKEERILTNPKGLRMSLSNAEFRLLCTFLQAPGHVFTRDQLMTQARGRSLEAFDRSMDVLVSRLRQKLGSETEAAPMIQTVRNAGYRLVVADVRSRPAWPST